MNNYIEKSLIKLKRQYGKDELVASLIKENKQLNFNIGLLTSERDELLHKLDNMSDPKNNTFKELKREVQSLKAKNKNLSNRLRKSETFANSLIK